MPTQPQIGAHQQWRGPMPQPPWQYLHPHAQVPYSQPYPTYPPNWPNRGPPIAPVYPAIPQVNHLPSRAPYPSAMQIPMPGQIPPHQGPAPKPTAKPSQSSVPEPFPGPLNPQSQVPHSQPYPTTPKNRLDNWPPITPMHPATSQVNHSLSRGSYASVLQNPTPGQKPPLRSLAPKPATKPFQSAVDEPVVQGSSEPSQPRPTPGSDNRPGMMRGGEVDAFEY
jgi:hypothetical protein